MLLADMPLRAAVSLQRSMVSAVSRPWLTEEFFDNSLRLDLMFVAGLALDTKKPTETRPVFSVSAC